MLSPIFQCTVGEAAKWMVGERIAAGYVGRCGSRSKRAIALSRGSVKTIATGGQAMSPNLRSQIMAIASWTMAKKWVTSIS